MSETAAWDRMCDEHLWGSQEGNALLSSSSSNIPTLEAWLAQIPAKLPGSTERQGAHARGFWSPTAHYSGLHKTFQGTRRPPKNTLLICSCARILPGISYVSFKFNRNLFSVLLSWNGSVNCSGELSTSYGCMSSCSNVI